MMATGVKPREDECTLTRSDLEVLQDAMKHKKFRDMLGEYCEEVTDPANQELYQKEMTQYEKERGYDVTFLNPEGNYVIKTSVAGDRKAFINICSNNNVEKPTYKVRVVDGRRGMDWQIPYSMTPPRDDYDTKKQQKLVIYDVMYHPDTLRMAAVNKEFRNLVNKTALEGLQKSYNIHFDSNNCRFPKSYYKGMKIPSVIRKEDPNYKPLDDEELEQFSPEMLEKLYPQHSYPEQGLPSSSETCSQEQNQQKAPSEKEKIPPKLQPPAQAQTNRKVRRGREEFTHVSDNGYTIPKYIIKQQKSVDLQDYTYHKDCKQYSAIPSSIVVEINLPMLSCTKDCALDVKEKSLSLKSEKPAKYKLNVPLPYSVNDECGNAKFDKTKRMLIVTLPVIKRQMPSDNNKSLRADSGLESEENLSSQSEDENLKEGLIVELSSTPAESPLNVVEVDTPKNSIAPFIDASLAYILPTYTHNVLDEILAFTFHVKNTEPDSVKVRKDGSKIFIKFTSVGSGFVPVHYAAIIEFEENITFENATGEAWDNNVILQLELANDIPQKFRIGLSSDSMISDYFDVSQIKKPSKADPGNGLPNEEAPLPLVAVTNLGTETNIVVSSNNAELDEDDIESPTAKDEEEEEEDDDVVFTENNFDSGAKSILRKSISYGRSFSESSVGDVASSMDYISSDCIPEESSFKKTVRFSDVIARQFYRYNSSIEGQKKKNQRKKSKKRNNDRRKSESEAEDDISSLSCSSKPRLKSALKQRRDSGMADTSDAENDYKNTPPAYDATYDDGNDNDKHPNDNNSMDGNCVHESNILKNEGTVTETADPVIWPSDENKLDNVNKKAKKTESITCDNIQHATNLYNPDKLNKGLYQEVKFKNDLIFDLDM